MIKQLLAGVVLCGIVGGGASAQTSTSQVDQRLGDQQQRIDQGLASGQLTQKEATGLQNRDANINARASADAARNGGTLTAGEDKRLNRSLNKDSRKIHRRKHNKVTQPGTTPPATP